MKLRELRKDEIIEAARQHLNKSDTFYNDYDAEYEMNAKNLIRRKLSEAVLVDTPLLILTYSVLVHRNTYERLAVATVPTNQEPPKINEMRTERLENARRSMIDIPINGFENYAIIHYNLTAERDKMSASDLIYRILNPKGMAFLWFDGEDEFFRIPIIKW